MREEDSLTAMEERFLRVTAQNQDHSFYVVYKRLGWSPQQAGLTRDALVKKGMITVQKGIGKTGTPAQFVRLTQKAGELLGISFTPITEVDELCRHRWDIKPANGPTSEGICKDCGAVKEFKNYIPDKVEGQPVGSLPPLFDR